MITNIINPLLQAISFISIWYLYQIMSKVKPLPGHLFLIFLSYVSGASYFNLVKIIVDPLFFLVVDLALVSIDFFLLFIQLFSLMLPRDCFQSSYCLMSYISREM